MPRSTQPVTVPASQLIAAGVLALLAACGQQSGPVDGPPPERVLLISLDTLRFDHTGFGGYDKPTTPFLDSLAARGVVFENHFANSNCTLPSHATMLTGLHWATHGVKPVGPTEDLKVLPQSITTLAERFQESGFATAGFASHGTWLHPDYGFDQGFDHFKTGWVDADRIIDQYLDYLDERQPQRSFTFLHFFDIHSDSSQEGPCLPYRSSPALVKQFAGEAPADFTGCTKVEGRENNCASNYLHDLSSHIEPLPDDHREFLIGLYDAGIRKLDDRLRALFATLEARGELDNTMVVITSDHGESFNEHGTMLHDTHHDEVARVPLIVLLPEASGVAPRKIGSLTQSTSLSATILGLAGLETIGQVPSLAPAIMNNAAVADEQVLFHGHIMIGRDEQGEFKFEKVGGKRKPHFYDRELDPAELQNQLADVEYQERHRERLLRIYGELNQSIAYCRELNKSIQAAESGETSKLSPEALKALEDLGYVGGVVGSSDSE
ncbi:MAG: arylsulfatase A-like enzyme [Candidatus Paceibacteria bacterium]|jgi:arylsulfatase A-like enzyme